MVPAMTELAALLAQLSGQNQQTAPDRALAAARLARASLDALVLKLLQSASQPPDIRTDVPAPRSELRVEIPMLLGAETGILQLLVERDGRHKRDPQRERGWRLRFAINFAATGEVGAEIALLGHAANIAIWAADPETAVALDAMLPELAAAIQRHGVELGTLPASASTSRFPSSSTRRRPRSSASCCEPAPASAGRRKPACIPRPGGAN
jgi:hypothetical protein